MITTSQRTSNSAIAPKFDPDDAMLIKINDNGCVDELEAVLGLRDKVPYGIGLVRNC